MYARVFRHRGAVLDQAVGVIRHGGNPSGAGNDTAAGIEPGCAMGVNKRLEVLVPSGELSAEAL